MSAPLLFQVCRKEALWGQEVGCADSQAKRRVIQETCHHVTMASGQPGTPSSLEAHSRVGCPQWGQGIIRPQTMNPEFLEVQLHSKELSCPLETVAQNGGSPGTQPFLACKI